MVTIALLVASAVMLGFAGWATWDGHRHMLRAEAAARQAQEHARAAHVHAVQAREAADQAQAARPVSRAYGN